MRNSILAACICLVNVVTIAQVYDPSIVGTARDSTELVALLSSEKGVWDNMQDDEFSTFVPRITNALTGIRQHNTRVQGLRIFCEYLAGRKLPSELSFVTSALLQVSKDAPASEKGDIYVFAGSLSREFFPVIALEYFDQAIAIYSSIADLGRLSRAHMERSLLLYSNGDFSGAVDDATIVDSLMTVSGEVTSFFRMSNLNTRGLALMKLGRCDDALESFRTARLIARQTNRRFWEGLITGNIGACYKILNRVTEALDAFKEDMRISVQEKEFRSAAAAAISTAEVLLDQGKLKDAGKYLDSASRWNTEKLAPLVRDEMLVRSTLYAATKEYDLAYYALARAKQMKDSIEAAKHYSELVDARNRSQIQRKDQALIELKRSHELAEKDKHIRNLIIGFSVSGFFAVTVLAFVFHRNSKRRRRDNRELQQKNERIGSMLEEIQVYNQRLKSQNERIEELNHNLEEIVDRRSRQLVEANRELNTFLYHSSHDMRRPITTILGLEQLAQMTTDLNEHEEILRRIRETAIEMDGMLGKLQMAYALSNHQLHLQPTDVLWLLQSVISSFKERLDLHRINIQISTIGPMVVSTDGQLLTIVFSNLIENSIQYRRERAAGERFIRIHIDSSTQAQAISFEDNGTGIEPDLISKIFDLHYRASLRSRGNGLGLFLVKRAVTVLGGDISVTSKYGEGSTFLVTIPVKIQLPADAEC